MVVGEDPYAEMFGDRENLTLGEKDLNVIKKVKASGKPMVVILLSGRPLIVNSVIKPERLNTNGLLLQGCY